MFTSKQGGGGGGRAKANELYYLTKHTHMVFPKPHLTP